MGCSFSPYLRSIMSRSLPDEQRPSTDTNSVQKISGPPPSSPWREYLAIICRKAQSVTSAIGARQKIGLFNFFQKFFMLKARSNMLGLAFVLVLELVVYLIAETKVYIKKRIVFVLKLGLERVGVDCGLQIFGNFFKVGAFLENNSRRSGKGFRGFQDKLRVAQMIVAFGHKRHRLEANFFYKFPQPGYITEVLRQERSSRRIFSCNFAKKPEIHIAGEIRRLVEYIAAIVEKIAFFAKIFFRTRQIFSAPSIFAFPFAHAYLQNLALVYFERYIFEALISIP